MTLLDRLKFWYWRKYKSIPHPEELLYYYVMSKVSEKELRRTKGLIMVFDYIKIKDLDRVAKLHRVTRERVRQMAFKYYRNWKTRSGK